MKTSESDTLARVCALARDYSMRGMSPRALFEASNYRQFSSKITTEAIASHIRGNRAFIGDWYMYSENKRTDRGWHFFIGDDQDKHSVVYYEGARIILEEHYDNEFDACASYIKHELEHF